VAFLPVLQDVVRSVDGALACSVMGFDGIAVESHQVEGAPDLDLQSTLIEYAAVLAQARNAAQLLKTGAVSEVSINSDHVLTIMRLVTQDYFLVLALGSGGNYGKGRYALRIAAPRIRAELEL
jgi:predicted regulator of Ras-like GTPase activity (Roadblock/LC7/MglB family)